MLKDSPSGRLFIFFPWNVLVEGEYGDLERVEGMLHSLPLDCSIPSAEVWTNGALAFSMSFSALISVFYLLRADKLDAFPPPTQIIAVESLAPVVIVAVPVVAAAVVPAAPVTALVTAAEFLFLLLLLLLVGMLFWRYNLFHGTSCWEDDL